MALMLPFLAVLPFTTSSAALPYPASPTSPLQGLQGGPHNHTISALAVALRQANTPEFKSYQQQVVSNCQALCKRMQELGYKVVSNGTDNHLILVDLKPSSIDGARLQSVLDEVSRGTVVRGREGGTMGGVRGEGH